MAYEKRPNGGAKVNEKNTKKYSKEKQEEHMKHCNRSKNQGCWKYRSECLSSTGCSDSSKTLPITIQCLCICVPTSSHSHCTAAAFTTAIYSCGVMKTGNMTLLGPQEHKRQILPNHQFCFVLLCQSFLCPGKHSLSQGGSKHKGGSHNNQGGCVKDCIKQG